MTKNTLTIAAAALALLAAPAYAGQTDTPSEAIQYSDLDLTTEKGRKQLDKRVDEAARNVCGMDQTATGTRITSQTARKCYRDAKRQIEQHLASVVRDGTRLGG